MELWRTCSRKEHTIEISCTLSFFTLYPLWSWFSSLFSLVSPSSRHPLWVAPWVSEHQLAPDRHSAGSIGPGTSSWWSIIGHVHHGKTDQQTGDLPPKLVDFIKNIDIQWIGWLDKPEKPGLFTPRCTDVLWFSRSSHSGRDRVGSLLGGVIHLTWSH